VIHMVRDGRDVALSYRAAHFGPKHAFHLAGRWLRYLSAAEDARAAVGEAAFLVVRYEDLLDRPEAVLERLCAFLAETYASQMMTYYRAPAAYPTDPRNEDNLRRPILGGNVQKWRGAMSARDRRIFEALAGEALRRYEYPPSVALPRIPAWEAISCRYLEDPPRRALSMLTNRQGFRLARESLRLYWRLRLQS
jgi:hypothetical protein